MHVGYELSVISFGLSKRKRGISRLREIYALMILSPTRDYERPCNRAPENGRLSLYLLLSSSSISRLCLLILGLLTNSMGSETFRFHWPGGDEPIVPASLPEILQNFARYRGTEHITRLPQWNAFPNVSSTFAEITNVLAMQKRAKQRKNKISHLYPE